MRRSASYPSSFAPRLSADYLLSLKDRSVRDRDRLYFAEGLRFAHAALEAGAPIQQVFLCPELARLHPSGDLSERLRRYPTGTVTRKQVVDLGFSPEPGGIVLVLRQASLQLSEIRLARSGAWLGLESLRTPGNFGTILRSMAAADASGLMLFGRSGVYADAFDPRVVRAGMGAQLHLPIIRTTYRELSAWSYRSEIRVLGADADANLEHRQMNFARNVLLMLGEERGGLSPGQLSACDDLIRIPMARGVDSLNVAMAATVLLFESFDQRRNRSSPRPRRAVQSYTDRM